VRNFAAAHNRVGTVDALLAYARAEALQAPTWFYGAASIASLLPLVKKAVTQADVEARRRPDVRPVAVGEVTLRSILTSVTASVTPAMADVLAPQQVAVGVSGGISIMINGIRILLEQRGDFVLKIDLKNAYNEIDRSALLRRCSEVPELAPFMPLLHATLMSATSLLVGPQRTRLFEQHHLEGQSVRWRGTTVQRGPEQPPAEHLLEGKTIASTAAGLTT